MKNINLKKIIVVIKNKGTLIFSIVGVIIFMIASTYILNNSSSSKLFNIDDNDVTKNDEYIEITGDNKAKVYISKKNAVQKINVEEYVTGVVAAEMPITFNEEALKAQAVAARTYYYSKRINNCTNSHGGEICDSEHCQVYLSTEKLMDKWPSDKYNEYYERAKRAVKKTENQVLCYDGSLVMYPQFFAVSSGKTENAMDVFNEEIPYLKSTESKGEEIAPKYKSDINISIKEFVNKINETYKDNMISEENIKDKVVIESFTDGGSVKNIKVGNNTISGVKFRNMFGINSTNFKISFKDGKVIISCTGYGHGVGMSQWGARVMADNGSSYDEILLHYYSGVEIKKVKYK